MEGELREILKDNVKGVGDTGADAARVQRWK
jgi:hypothetical protein